MDGCGLIGVSKNNKLPWHLAKEWKHFKATTKGHAILMGRKTYSGLPKKPLPDRVNYVATRNPVFIKEHHGQKEVKIVQDVQKFCQQNKNQLSIIDVCGGKQIYQLAWPYGQEVIVSVMHDVYTGDVYFPFLDWTKFKFIKLENYDGFTVYYYSRRLN